ncbi:hypothetical protein ACJMK2_013187 [Sinanodonta woodiana]|uniref:Mab-21-like HhH/H2TH-like domain-containing protein n=1 Tax=Sinanodonta woodiana TaxID=1069815 RepID=A0ABD3UZW6_SINWO
MASHVTNEVDRNENRLQIISSNIDKMMSYEGFDLMRKISQTVTSCQDIISALCNTHPSCNEQIYGSIGEGLIYPFNAFCDRDLDIVRILPNNIAIENVHETHLYGSETRIYLIENVPNRPGYCYLRVINEGSMFPKAMHLLTREVYGGQYFSGLALKEMVKDALTICNIPVSTMDIIRDVCDSPNLYLENLNQQGPATHFRFKAQMQLHRIVCSLTKCDYVYVVHCPIWPSSAFEWLNRRSRSGWPCQLLKQEMAQKGIFLAPVGCKQDPSNEIQWRYSFNETERQLMRSFNSTQAKCYALLKRIIAEFVKPLFGDDVITSYHLKTLMFWTVEEIDLQAWIPANLVECIFLVLKRLTQCIEDENCPSYFIPTENLFREKSTLDNKEVVSARMHNILSEGWLLLFRLPNLAWDIFNSALCSADYHQILYTPIEMIIINKYLAELDIYQINETGRINSKFSEMINTLTTNIYSLRDERIKDLLKNVTTRLCSIYGTHCLSLARLPLLHKSRKRSDEFAGDIYIEISCCRNQLDCLAKRANYAYMCGKFQSTVSTAFDLLQRYLHLRVRAITVDIPASVQFDNCVRQLFNYNDIVQMILTNNFTHLFDSMQNMFSSNEVIFGKIEIHAIPGNVKVEMFKIGWEEDSLNNLPTFRRCVSVDPYFYVTFLSFQAYYDMGNQEAADTVLEIMEIICSETPNSHLPTSLNLLGDCYLKTGQIVKAMEKFTLSMKRKSSRNAAPWHIARLVWRKLLERWSQMRDGDI